MTNPRGSRRRGDPGREPGGFIALPWSVLDCPAYSKLSYPARCLLMEFARQFVGDNNGRLLASTTFLAKRGWKSADVITRAKRELLAAGFIFETVKGHRPNKASWYAVTWRTLDRLPGYDVGAQRAFERGAYRKIAVEKNEAVIPGAGTKHWVIAPSDVIETAFPIPPGGTMASLSEQCSIPSAGNHLEKPSEFEK